MTDLQEIKARKKDLENKMNDLLVEFDMFCESKGAEFISCNANIEKTYVDYLDGTQRCINTGCNTNIVVKV